MKRCVYINDDACGELYCNNRITNTKYNLWNFLPKNLYEQFRRFMNQYFLLIALLQLWPLITPVNPATTWGPLILISAVSATKEAWDDYSRYLADVKANERKVGIVKNGILTEVLAQDIRVGNIVWLRENDEVPCDLVLLGTSDSQGICYVETSALDGETDLKTRNVPPICTGLSVEQLSNIKGLLECSEPDRDIRIFDANLRLFPPVNDDKCPLSIKNTILQSCYLRYTEWICGVAIYTGNQTKLGMSRGSPEPKFTASDVMIDKLTATVFLFQIAVVSILGFYGNIWKDRQSYKQWYLKYPVSGPWYDILVIPLRFELLCSIIIPISLKVTMDLIKVAYAKFIDWDEYMFDAETNEPPHATNTAISEDLGQVEYIMTDKTGTLTENRMIFKKCFVNGNFYGNRGDALEDVDFINAITSNDPRVVKFLMVMAMCNTVIPVKSNNGGISYKAQSQDEEALVNAASKLNLVLANKNDKLIEINFNGSMICYELLDVLEFSSDRKKMSVVVKDCKSEKILLLSKGADDAMLPYSFPGQPVSAIAEAVERYSQLGLRTLCLGWRELHIDEYIEWSSEFKEASCSLLDRELKLAEVCQAIERDLEILGVTAIEDRLQDGVPETIELLKNAGISIWMLTGDKQSTAVQIALLSHLVISEPETQLLYINGKTEEEVISSLERVLLTVTISSVFKKEEFAFVMDGWGLEIILRSHKESFMELATHLRTAIFCRMTPLQKAQLVEMLKSCKRRTLAIGDGGNDVRMIQQADIGVGISGREGLQAARAADYSIGKFKFLKRLILVHGRHSYNCSSFISQYSIYKSLLICLIQILFSFFSGLSGTSLFNSVSLMAYNVIYTSIPVMTMIFDKDLSEKTVLRYPQVFVYSQTGRLLNLYTFAEWFGRSLYHALVVFLIAICAYADEQSEMEGLSMVAVSGCIWLQAFVVCMDTNSFTSLQLAAIWGNLLIFYAINLLASSVPTLGMYSIMFRLCAQPMYWVTMALIVVVGMTPLLALKYLRYTYQPTSIDILQQIEQSKGPACGSESRYGLEALDLLHSPDHLVEVGDSVSEPLLPDSPSRSASSSSIRSAGQSMTAGYLQPRASLPYSRNCKDS